MKSFSDIYSQIINTPSDIMKLYKQELTIKAILSILLIIVDIAICVNFHSTFFGLIFTFTIIFFILLFFTIVHFPTYSRVYKKAIISKLVEFYDESFKYSPGSLISSIFYSNAEFEQDFTDFHSEDGISGILDSLHEFKMGEVKTSKIVTYTDSDGNTRRNRVVQFKGYFIHVASNQLIPTPIYVRRKFFATRNLAIPKQQIRYRNIQFSNLEDIELDNSEFEKSYYIRSQDRFLTMQVFTPDLLQQLVDFKNIYKLIPEITLKENHIFMRFHINSSIFEPPAFKSPLNYLELQKEYKFINSMMSICEALAKNIDSVEI